MPILTLKQRGDSNGSATIRHSHKTQLNAICVLSSYVLSICVAVVMVYVWITLSHLFRHYFYLISISFDHDPLYLPKTIENEIVRRVPIRKWLICLRQQNWLQIRCAIFEVVFANAK